MKNRNENASVLQSRLLFHQTNDLRQYRVKDYRPYFVISLMINIVIIASSFKGEDKVIVKYKTIFKEKVEEAIEVAESDIELTDEAILKELIEQDCVLPNVALAQFKIESQHFKSDICRENKNFAGIKTSRSEYVIGKNRNHCAYKTYRDCIRDYIRIQTDTLRILTGDTLKTGNMWHW